MEPDRMIHKNLLISFIYSSGKERPQRICEKRRGKGFFKRHLLKVCMSVETKAGKSVDESPTFAASGPYPLLLLMLLPLATWLCPMTSLCVTFDSMICCSAKKRKAKSC